MTTSVLWCIDCNKPVEDVACGGHRLTIRGTLARDEREVKAEALREAADDLAALGNVGFPTPWLRARADALSEPRP